MGSDPEVTRLLNRLRGGDESARADLLSAAYRELRAVAGGLFRSQGSDHTLQPTALVHEVCVRILGAGNAEWNDRKHFIRAAAMAMRNLLADHARARRADRRGGGAVPVTLDGTGPEAIASHPIDVMVLDETIDRLAAHDPRLGQVFELRFLAGLSVAHTAELLEVSERTVELDSKFVRAWLKKELGA